MADSPRWSLALLSLAAASVLGWGARTLPWQDFTAFAVITGVLAALHGVTGVLAVGGLGLRVRAWRVQSWAALAWLAWIAWKLVTAGVYIAEVYGSLGDGMAVVLFACTGLCALVVLPLAVWGLAATGGLGNFSRLFAESGTPARSAELDVLSPENADLYWARDDSFDTVLDVSFGRPGLIALCGVFEDWLRHFLGLAVRIEPVGMIRDERWVWHVGLDAEANVILNELYNGQELDEDRLRQILSLFRLSFRDTTQMRADIAGRPIYLGMAMTDAQTLRIKPQNLLANLPLATAS